MQMAGRSFTSGDGYRYGFNGMERDDEVKGSGNSYDFGARMYDSRLGRWFATDPSEAKYAYLSTYNFSRNNPILFVDPDGKDARVSLTKSNGVTTIKLSTTLRVAKGTSQAQIDQMQSSANKYLNDQKVSLEKDGKQYNIEFEVTVAEGDLMNGDNIVNIGNGRSHAHATGEFKDINTETNTGTMSIDIPNEITLNEGSLVGNTTAHEVLHLFGLADRYRKQKGFSIPDEGYSDDIQGSGTRSAGIDNTEQFKGLIDAVEKKVSMEGSNNITLEKGDQVDNYNISNVDKKQSKVTKF